MGVSRIRAMGMLVGKFKECLNGVMIVPCVQAFHSGIGRKPFPQQFLGIQNDRKRRFWQIPGHMSPKIFQILTDSKQGSRHPVDAHFLKKFWKNSLLSYNLMSKHASWMPTFQCLAKSLIQNGSRLTIC